MTKTGCINNRSNHGAIPIATFIKKYRSCILRKFIAHPFLLFDFANLTHNLIKATELYAKNNKTAIINKNKV